MFVYELLEYDWAKGCTLEIANPSVDNAGYDLIAEKGNIIRHIQLKTSFKGSSTSEQKIHMSLSSKPAACIVWVFFSDDAGKLYITNYFFFGNQSIPKEQQKKPLKQGEYIRMPMRGIDTNDIAKHSKGNSDGEKGYRKALRVVKKSEFKKEDRFENIEGLYNALFPSK